MIVVRDRGRIRLVRQVDHQVQCAQMARAWGNARFARPEPYGPVIDAAACHDEGWRACDATPHVAADGGVVDFPDLDRTIHAPMYATGIDLAAARGARAGLLVSMHGQGLYEKRLGLDGPRPERSARPPGERAFIAAQDRLQVALRAQLGDGPGLEAWAWAAYRLLQAWDVLSLYLCWHGRARGERWTLPQVPAAIGDPGVDLHVAAAGPDVCTVDPWPFGVERLDLSVPARWIPDAGYRDDAALRAAVDAAEERTLRLVVCRPDGRPAVA
jgi:hypothetical protein